MALDPTISAIRFRAEKIRVVYQKRWEDKYLGREGFVETVREQMRQYETPFVLEVEVEKQRRVKVTLFPPEIRFQNFKEIELGYATEDAVEKVKHYPRCDRNFSEKGGV